MVCGTPLLAVSSWPEWISAQCRTPRPQNDCNDVALQCYLAPKHTLAAVERLDAATGQPTDTTTDTAVLMSVNPDDAGLQQVTQ